MGRHSTQLTSQRSQDAENNRKRKHSEDDPSEILVDLNKAEPPSKKALRKAKKHPGQELKLSETEHEESHEKTESTTKDVTSNSKRGAHGIWIGNMPWDMGKEGLRSFFADRGAIAPEDITRVHLPTPRKSSRRSVAPTREAKNKGFAYVDFSSGKVRDKAIQLSETLLSGRRVLIKDAANFDGRPDAQSNGTADAHRKSSAKPGKRVFVGNLEFDTTEAMLSVQFTQCGSITKAHVATFEDSGKCKGYAWIDFEDIAAAEAAVKGQGSVKRFRGRTLRVEFAEDPSARYRKRFSQGNPTGQTYLEESDPV